VQCQNVQPLQNIIINRPDISSGYLTSVCTIVLIVLEYFFCIYDPHVNKIKEPKIKHNIIYEL
ncbi:MAG: hypothetical protein JW717_11610, partial [Marinilabiliaceae bacterium]|nr:hypothetical protein [Marinilabiliaceae bacterium]